MSCKLIWLDNYCLSNPFLFSQFSSRFLSNSNVQRCYKSGINFDSADAYMPHLSHEYSFYMVTHPLKQEYPTKELWKRVYCDSLWCETDRFYRSNRQICFLKVNALFFVCQQENGQKRSRQNVASKNRYSSMIHTPKSSQKLLNLYFIHRLHVMDEFSWNERDLNFLYLLCSVKIQARRIPSIMDISQNEYSRGTPA